MRECVDKFHFQRVTVRSKQGFVINANGNAMFATINSDLESAPGIAYVNSVTKLAESPLGFWGQ